MVTRCTSLLVTGAPFIGADEATYAAIMAEASAYNRSLSGIHRRLEIASTVKNPDICQGAKEREGGHQINAALSQSKLKVSVIQADKLKKITVEPIFQIDVGRKAAACYCKSGAAGVFRRYVSAFFVKHLEGKFREHHSNSFLDEIKMVQYSKALVFFLLRCIFGFVPNSAAVLTKTSLSLKVPAKTPKRGTYDARVQI